MILLTGASGYVGSRLLRELEAAGRTVRCLAREPARVAVSRTTTEVVRGDDLDESSLDAAMVGVGQVFCLVHSMASVARFTELDRESAATSGVSPIGPAYAASSISAASPTMRVRCPRT